jgi:hypothetical protein
MTNKLLGVTLALVGAALLIAVLFWLYVQRSTELPAPVAQTPPVQAVVEAPPPAPAASVPELPAEPAPAPASAAVAAGTSLQDLLVQLLGRKTVLSMLQTDDFARRCVATIDNLGRDKSSARLWPVNPTPGRFSVRAGADGTRIAPDNSLRYTPFVLMVEALDTSSALAAYSYLYPQLQRAYEELGFPGRSFHRRLVEVIELLLATPDLAQPARMVLPVINSPVQPARPWVMYEFEDPAHAARPAGQRLLLRMGPENARRLKARLRDFHQALAPGRPAR